MPNRYSRQIALPEIGEQGQTKLAQTSVLCIGAGGLGSAALYYLVAAGVGHIAIIDGDKVDITNLHRQILFTEADVGRFKAIGAAKKLQQLNNEVEITAIAEFINKNNILNLLCHYDYIIDGTDSFATKLLINDACFTLQKTWISASLYQFMGQGMVFKGGQIACLRCVFEDVEYAGLPNCENNGTLGMLPGLMGTWQALELIKLVCNLEHSFIGKLLTWDFLKGKQHTFELTKSPACKLCNSSANFDDLWHREADIISIDELKKINPYFLLDVRTLEEYNQFHINGYLIPLNELPNRLDELPKDKTIIIHCSSGYRSNVAYQLLQKQGFKQLKKIEGHIAPLR